MSNVTLVIGERKFRIACAPGEEEHVTELAQAIDARVTGMGDLSGQNDANILLYAALLMADELYERHGSASPAEIIRNEETRKKLNLVAERLEGLASRLEQQSDSD